MDVWEGPRGTYSSQPIISKGRRKALFYSPLLSHVGPETSDPSMGHLLVVHFGYGDWHTGRVAQQELGREAVVILLGQQMRRGFEQIRHCRGCDPPCCLPMLSLVLCGLNLGLVSPEAVPLLCLGHTGTVACFQPWSQL